MTPECRLPIVSMDICLRKLFILARVKGPGAFAAVEMIRELRPQDVKFERSKLTQREAVLTAKLSAGVLGKAHGRQMKSDVRSAWRKDLYSSPEGQHDRSQARSARPEGAQTA